VFPTWPPSTAVMYFEGKQPARSNRAPWKKAVKILMRTMVMRVMARNSSCQVSVFTMTNTRVQMNKFTTKHKDHGSLDLEQNKTYILVL
jgi:hypothetical protein